MPREIDLDGVVHEFPDDFTDAEIAAALSPSTAQTGSSAQPFNPLPILEALGRPVLDVGIGAAKKLAETGVRGGAMLRKVVPGLDAISNMLPSVEVPIEPTNAAQRLGGTLEQVAEIASPSRALVGLGERVAAKLAPAAARAIGATAARALPRAAIEGAGSAGLALAQGASPGGAVLSGALGAVVPGAGEMVRSMRGGLASQAEKKAVQALGPTKERYKAMAARIAPDVLKRGLIGSRQSLKDRAEAMVSEVGPQIDEAITKYAERQVDTAPVIQALEDAKDAFRTVREVPLREAVASGEATRTGAEIVGDMVRVPIVYEKRPVVQLDALQGILRDLGPTPRVDQLVAVRRAWDQVVSQAGGFQHRAGGAIGIPLKEQTEAWAKREATGAIRKLLDAEVPELAALNKEYSFWRSLDDVLTQTLQRTAPQGPGLGQMVATGAGRAVGAAAGAGGGAPGAIGGAVLGGKVAQKLNDVFRSARWTLVDAKMRDELAKSLASGNSTRILGTIGRVGAIQSGSGLTAER